jgi:hypothetical protein
MIDSARQQWDEGSRRLEAEAVDPARYRQLCRLVEVLLAELRRKVGQRFTLAELAVVHARAEDWARDLVQDAMPSEPKIGVGDVPLVVDAAFHAYARGATDYGA